MEKINLNSEDMEPKFEKKDYSNFKYEEYRDKVIEEEKRQRMELAEGDEDILLSKKEKELTDEKELERKESLKNASEEIMNSLEKIRAEAIGFWPYDVEDGDGEYTESNNIRAIWDSNRHSVLSEFDRVNILYDYSLNIVTDYSNSQSVYLGDKKIAGFEDDYNYPYSEIHYNIKNIEVDRDTYDTFINDVIYRINSILEEKELEDGEIPNEAKEGLSKLLDNVERGDDEELKKEAFILREKYIEGTNKEFIKRKDIEKQLEYIDLYFYGEWSENHHVWGESETGAIDIVNVNEYEGVPQCEIGICTNGNSGERYTGLTYKDQNRGAQTSRYHKKDYLKVFGQKNMSKEEFIDKVEEVIEKVK